jgi:hypothetical protein
MEIEEELAHVFGEKVKQVGARESRTPIRGARDSKDQWAEFAEIIRKKAEEKNGEKREIVAGDREGGIRRPVKVADR